MTNNEFEIRIEKLLRDFNGGLIGRYEYRDTMREIEDEMRQCGAAAKICPNLTAYVKDKH